MEEKINQILALDKRVTDKKLLTKDEKRLLIDTYRQATGIKKREGCGACFIEIYFYFYKQRKTMKTQTEFEVAPGKRIYHRSNVLMGKVKTEQALNHLKDCPGAIRLYSSFPSDWRERSQKFDILASVRTEKLVEPEPVLTSEEIALNAKKEALASLTLDQLKDIAEQNEYPKTEWSKIKKEEKFIEYLLGK